MSGWLRAQRARPVGRRQGKRLAKMGDRGLCKIGKAKQCLVRRFAHLSDSLQAGREQRILYPRWESNFTGWCLIRKLWRWLKLAHFFAFTQASTTANHERRTDEDSRSTPVRRDQFEISPKGITHTPTGAKYSPHPGAPHSVSMNPSQLIKLLYRRSAQRCGVGIFSAARSDREQGGRSPDAGRSKAILEMVAKLAGIYRRRITAASSQEIARYISEDTMARMVIPGITMFILRICAPYWMR